MTHYMLSVHSRDGEAGPAMTAEEIQESWSRISALEEDLKATGAWVFSARLHEAGTATVVRVANGEVLMTDGPFAESKDHLGGFYIIEAADLDAALVWAARVTSAVGHPIEVRPFVDVAGG